MRKPKLERLTDYDTFAIPVEQIFVDAGFNCRDEFSLREVGPLAKSIEQHGLQFPVIVAPRKGPIPYRLVCGFRRLAACSDILKMPAVPASVRTDLTEAQLRILNFAENLERDDLNVMEEAKAVAKLVRHGESIRSVAAQINREQRWIRVRLRMLQLPKPVQDLAVSCRFGETALEVLWQQKTPDAQIKAAESMAAAKRKGIKEFHQAAGVKHSFAARRTKKAVRDMTAKILSAGLEGGMPRFGAWFMGEISDDELWLDVLKELAVHRLAKGQNADKQTEDAGESDSRN